MEEARGTGPMSYARPKISAIRACILFLPSAQYFHSYLRHYHLHGELKQAGSICIQWLCQGPPETDTECLL